LLLLLILTFKFYPKSFFINLSFEFFQAFLFACPFEFFQVFGLVLPFEFTSNFLFCRITALTAKTTPYNLLHGKSGDMFSK